jgi:hypothetical protein
MTDEELKAIIKTCVEQLLANEGPIIANDISFEEYNTQGKQAGTYVFQDRKWNVGFLCIKYFEGRII